MSKQDERGVTLKEHLETVERQTGIRPEELNLPDFPDLLLPVWRIFIDLSNSRSQGFSGGGPITYEQMKAYMDITGNIVGPIEAEIIKMLDREYLKVMNG